LEYLFVSQKKIMQVKPRYILLLVFVTVLCSCGTPRSISTKYYERHEPELDKIEVMYKELYKLKPFSLQFTNKKFDEVAIEIMTDSIKYVYTVGINEPRLNDTLRKYGMNVKGTADLIRRMKSIKCTWINNLDYNSETGIQSLVFMSIRQVSANLPFVPPKYYILAYFNKPQYYDSEGRLLTGRRLRKTSKINGDVFWRINDKVSYTVSSSFR
jgi:hypothetical protein